MGPYRTPPPPPPPPPRRRRDREELVVHGVIVAIGAIGIGCGVATDNFGTGATLAAILVAVGMIGMFL